MSLSDRQYPFGFVSLFYKKVDDKEFFLNHDTYSEAALFWLDRVKNEVCGCFFCEFAKGFCL